MISGRWLNFDPEKRDRDILLSLYKYAQKGQMNLGNLDKANEISEKIKEIEDEIEAEKEADEEADMEYIEDY